MPEPCGQATAAALPKNKSRPQGYPTGGFAHFQLLEMNFARMGLSTASAMIAATMFRTAAA